MRVNFTPTKSNFSNGSYTMASPYKGSHWIPLLVIFHASYMCHTVISQLQMPSFWTSVSFRGKELSEKKKNEQ